MRKISIGTPLQNQRGFTLIELLAVMTIVAVLAGVVSVSVIGTAEQSQDAQVIQDASTLGAATTTYFADQEEVESVIPLTLTVLDVSPDVEQLTSSRWPETHLTSAYASLFPGDSVTTVTEIGFLDENGSVLSITDPETNLAIDFAVEDLLDGFTAIDFDLLLNGAYINSVPDSADQSGQVYASFLWLLEKADTSNSLTADVSRNVAVFKLITVTELAPGSDDRVILLYQRIV